VIFDSYNALANGCYSETPDLDLVEFFNSVLELTSQFNSSLALSVNRDLFFSETEGAFYRELKQDYFTHIFELNRNLAGYSRDVHGQLNVISNQT